MALKTTDSYLFTNCTQLFFKLLLLGVSNKAKLSDVPFFFSNRIGSCPSQSDKDLKKKLGC